MGDLSRVKRWFDESGAPALGDVEVLPSSPYMPEDRVEEYGASARRAARVLDWRCWSSSIVTSTWRTSSSTRREHQCQVELHERQHPASGLLQNTFDSVRFLITVASTTIKDYGGTAGQGWALHALKDEDVSGWRTLNGRKPVMSKIRNASAARMTVVCYHSRAGFRGGHNGAFTRRDSEIRTRRWNAGRIRVSSPGAPATTWSRWAVR
jgi:hypothetical protein